MCTQTSVAQLIIIIGAVVVVVADADTVTLESKDKTHFNRLRCDHDRLYSRCRLSN